MLNRAENTIVSWENDKSAAQRLRASAQMGDRVVDVALQMTETSVAFPIARADLRAAATFLAAVADEIESWDDDIAPDEPGDLPVETPGEDEGTVA